MINTIPDIVPVIAQLQALLQRGTVYAPEGDDPLTACSCYGLVRHSYGLAGILLPETPEEAEALFQVVPPPYQPWDLVLSSFEPYRGSRHLSLLTAPPWGFHCSRATNGLARFCLYQGVWRRVFLHALRYREWLDAD